MRILHIMITEKFIPPFINFVISHFDISNHCFAILGEPAYEYGLTKDHPVIFLNSREQSVSLLREFDRIIIHGLWNPEIIDILFLEPSLLKKCRWAMWGGDFYFPERHSEVKAFVIKNMGAVISDVPGDVEYLRENYGFSGRFIRSLLYQSNVSLPDSEPNYDAPSPSTISILVGNSADPTNNHIEVLDKIAPFKDFDIQVIIPLSYGNKEHAKRVADKARELFGDKAKPLMEMMPLQEYLTLLDTVSIGIFNHNRQQALGNIISLLAAGKMVYLRNDISTWSYFKDLGLTLGAVSEFNLDLLTAQQKRENVKAVKSHYSEQRLFESMNDVFYS